MIIVLNGAPRSGKSTLAAEIVASFPGSWVNLGVDSMMAATPEHLLPGMGLRPGGERPDLELFVQEQYRALFAQAAHRSTQGENVVIDVGIHDDYSAPLGIAGEMGAALGDLEVVLVGVHCSLDELRTRRDRTGYPSWRDGEAVPKPVLRWQHAVHEQLDYDVEVDTSTMSVADCAAVVRMAIAS